MGRQCRFIKRGAACPPGKKCKTVHGKAGKITLACPK